LNQPISIVATTETDREQNRWWTSQINEESAHAPKYSKDTTQRSDYQQHAPQRGLTRHSSNPLIVATPGICMCRFLRYTLLFFVCILLYLYILCCFW